MYPPPGPYGPSPARGRSGLNGCLIIVTAVFGGFHL
jgi:hypothetical protein